jgi:aconitate hydratase
LISKLIKKIYSGLPAKVAAARKLVGKPLTLSEKILYAHLSGPLPASPYNRGKDYVDFALIVLLCRMQQHKWLYYNL